MAIDTKPNLSNNNVYLGFNSGSLETGSCKLFIDALDRGSEANGRTNSLIYGCFNATPANQLVRLNSQLELPYLTGCTNSDVLYYNSSDGTVSYGTPSNTAGGTDGTIQYNNGGVLGGTCLKWDDSVNHMGWGISASTTGGMLSILKDVPYDSSQDIIKVYGKNTIDEPVLEFNLCVGGPSWGSALSVRRIDGYFQGAYSDLLINYECATSKTCILNPYMPNISLTPTSTPAAVEGRIYYDSGTKKLKFYNGTAWETVTSA